MYLPWQTFATLQQLVLGALTASDTQVPITTGDLGVKPKDDPVCIVGAGPTGLTIAHELEAKGYSTVIFEKHAEVGGKCQAYYDGPNGNTYHPLGALLFTNKTYHETLPIIEASGLPLTPGIAPPLWQRYVYGPAEQANIVAQYPTPDDTTIEAIARELVRYKQFWEEHFEPKYTAIGYPHGIPKEFTVPIGTWLDKNDYLYLPSIMQLGMVPYGYGDLTETPTIYMLQYFTPEVLGVFVGMSKSYIVDFHRVFKHYASTLKQTKIHLNTTITYVDRHDANSPMIRYNPPTSAPTTQRCTRLILAFPPTLPALESLNLPLTMDEIDLFMKLTITPYWSSAISVRTPPFTSFVQNPFKPVGEPVAFVRLHNASDVATAWQWGDIYTVEKAESLLVDTINKVHAGLNVSDGPQTVTARDVKALKSWHYFPHFSGEDLLADKGDAYGRLERLQGVGGTWWASGLNGFETVEFAVRAGKDLVRWHF